MELFFGRSILARKWLAKTVHILTWHDDSDANREVASSSWCHRSQFGRHDTGMPACCVLNCPHAGMFAVTKAQMERSRDTHARRQGNLNRLDLSFDLARSSDVCYHHTFDVLKPHLEDVVSKATDKQYSMKRREMIHDVLWSTGTHELCRNDEGPPVRLESGVQRIRPARRRTS